ncbi:ArdC family protein [Mucilaginibacter kameinonensis]|uniref:ArdC family protein n=1 Tax=Mucilaginibacter kameinonensis TaxID=452286 RepID=UPI000EF7598D|nr:zincin-like metallopeptidase domain-containing protein [Mucilaginibacter kameinonensis]
MATETKKMYELVAEKIIEQLKLGTAPWQKPWNSAGTDYSMPYNAVTGNPYKGLNALYLHLFSPYQDPRWATFKQAESEGWQVQKGAKGFMINFVKTHDLRTKLDEHKRPVTDAEGKPIKIKVELANPIITKAWVFNAEQIKGIPALPVRDVADIELWEKVSRAENIIKASGAKIEHVAGDRAFYSPLFDKINMPNRPQFESADRYYSTLLHELGHWTGHHSRLDRDLVNRHGSPDYAREELRAEIASMILGNELKIGHDPQQHIAYVDSWIKVLTDTPYEIHAAAADAQRIFDYVMDFERKLEEKQETTRALDYNPNTLQKGDIIKYNGTSYEVLEAEKKNFLIQDLTNKHKVQLTTTDGLFNSLVDAKRNNRNSISVLDKHNDKVVEPDYSISTADAKISQADNSFKRKI